MTNKEIANTFELLGKIMELHHENPYKIRSYQNAYLILRKLDRPLKDFTHEELLDLKGVGEAIADKITELLKTGHMATLEKYLAKTPPGVVEMLELQGLGPKKIAILWKELGIESPGELMYACNENRLTAHKGFGEKTQHKIIESIVFLQSNQGKYLFTQARHHLQALIRRVQEADPDALAEMTGPLRRGLPVVEKAEMITTCSPDLFNQLDPELLTINKTQAHTLEGRLSGFLPVEIHLTDKKHWASALLTTTGPEHFVKTLPSLKDIPAKKEEDLFHSMAMPYLSPELRDIHGVEKLGKRKLDHLVQSGDLKGLIHCHTTYSDGIHSLSEMAAGAREAGYEYIVITDHSQAAAYANGLKPDRLQEQWKEIDHCNEGRKGFRVLKGIECDILSSGELDYHDQLLSRFEVVIASIHSAFQMDQAKATARLIRAIENPHTHILGHPSGRLFLSREGYPLDYKKIIDACKANQVAIELNANPQRLDLDYSYIPYCIEKEVYISINPDAHNRGSIRDVDYGITAARKGLLPRELCLNAMESESLLRFCRKG
ncbi:MAG TPA: helix-hairpin-helix domain-containing protein [Saprospiraceae bacterium]|nr:helix-hairpin-helix domain-containing protein [Saprospiraceae bacterium]HNT18833.1 helix-hairpin-helix domain-containing protein [Saprospiraceae bacterium]